MDIAGEMEPFQYKYSFVELQDGELDKSAGRSDEERVDPCYLEGMGEQFSKTAGQGACHLDEENSSANFVEAGGTHTAYCAGGDGLNHSTVAEDLSVCELHVSELQIVRSSQRRQE